MRGISISATATTASSRNNLALIVAGVWSLTSRTLQYCPFTSSEELETLVLVSFSRFSKALASDWTESKLTLEGEKKGKTKPLVRLVKKFRVTKSEGKKQRE